MITKDKAVTALARSLALFQDPLRLKLFLLLGELGENQKELCVSELAGALSSSVSNMSHQLRKLELAGVVERIRKGRMICYQLRRTSFNMKLYSFLRSNLNLIK